jgi:hypothetical protein
VTPERPFGDLPGDDRDGTYVDVYVLHAQRLSEVHGVEPYPHGRPTYQDYDGLRDRVAAILRD